MGLSTILYTRMWTILFLCILGINLCQADDSTQMLYAKLIIDKNAIDNITSILKSFMSNTAVVEAPVMTTVCTNGTDSKVCQCKPGHRWNDTFCQSNPNCCGDATCTLDKTADAKCVPNTTVTITGSLTVQGSTYVTYLDCLEDTTNPKYTNCRDQLLAKMKTVYSTLWGFDSLNITGFRIGSIIADFNMIIASSNVSQALITTSVKISKTLSASLDIETSGVVNLVMPKMPVPYGASNQVIRCTTKEDLKTKPQWSIINSEGQYNITTGTFSTVDTSSPTNSSIILKQVTELWDGEYSCIYQNMDNASGFTVNILHKDSAVLDVALLPTISVFTEPSFPRCKTKDDILQATANCEIKNSTEPYNVTWDGNLKGQLKIESGNILVYTTRRIISCADNSTNGYLTVCTFTNTLGNISEAEVLFNIIPVDVKFCAADGDWEDTKANFIAVLKCTNMAGQRTRKCDSEGKWGEEESRCVNFDLNNILKNAAISDTGLGSLDKNAETIFSNLANATQNPEAINTFPNLNTSVIVISTMSSILTGHGVNDTTTSKHLLASSSNLLDRSLGNSWKTTNRQDNQTLAEKYLQSVENLIAISNISNDSNQINLHVQTCTGACINTVFNATVTVKSPGNGTIKTAGFQHLQDYLPNKNETSDINSIVVSTTTTEGGEENLQITIKFPLLTPRPPDVSLQCVSWDYNHSKWTDEGCVWGGASKPEECTCSHLTSFAILMSRYPIEIPYMTEITYAGLSVSVVSLVISLLIELIVWSKVVKTNALYLRHTAHVNISLCLLVADCCFLASSNPQGISEIWCRIAALLKHFCYLAMFFWMLSLSTTLLHQTVFLFHEVSKKTYLRFSLILGYVCPFLIVFITFLTNNAGAQDMYFSKKTCWLIYSGLLKGTIYTFILPVGIIVFINLFAMVVVIIKLLDHKSRGKSHETEIRAAKTVLRSVILLTPIFGLPWIFGFATFSLDLTAGTVTLAVNYAFVLLNTFQGLFILLTTCLGDKMTRDALLDSFRKKAPPTFSESSTKLETTTKKS